MKPKIRKTKAAKTHHHRAGRTRSSLPLRDMTPSDAFRDVEPPGFRDHPRASIEADQSDPDVEDSEGGE